MATREERWAKREADFKANYAKKAAAKHQPVTPDAMQAAWRRHASRWWYRLFHYGR